MSLKQETIITPDKYENYLKNKIRIYANFQNEISFWQVSDPQKRFFCQVNLCFVLWRVKGMWSSSH